MSKRETIEPHPGDKRYVRRDAQGQFSESDEAGKSLSQDHKRDAQTSRESSASARQVAARRIAASIAWEEGANLAQAE